MRSTLRMLATLALGGGLALGCSDGTGAGAPARLTLQITDAPTAPFSSAEVDIGRVTLIPADGSPITLAESGGTFDLLDFQNGVTAELAALDVPAGDYVQLRLEVTGARVTLADGLAFRDGTASADLKVPSGAQSGIKLNLFDDAWRNGQGDSLLRSAGVPIASGETIIVLDFDVARNFVFTGPRAAPTGVIFRPLVRAVVRNIAGSISGVVTDADGQPVADATVRATLTASPELQELQTAEATAVTADDGSYTIHFLVPGTYTVDVDNVTTDAQTVTVERGQAVTAVNFVITL
jgi:hypothetical protein